jgi:hypothetical protein
VELSSYRRLLSQDRSAILGHVTMPSFSTRALVAGACAAILVLSACAGKALTVTPSAGTSPASTPSDAPTPFAGPGFRTSIPSGWVDETTSPSALAASAGNGTVLMILGAPTHGTVVVRTTPQPVADDQLAQYLTSVVPAGSTDVSAAEPVNIDGVSGVVITFTATAAGSAAQENEEMVVNQAGNTYAITLSAPQAGFTADSAGLQAILNSWTWG